MNVIKKYGTYYLINNVKYIPKPLINQFAKWDPVYFKRNDIGFYYDKDTLELRIPAGVPKAYVKALFPDYFYEEIDEYTHNKIDISLSSAPRDYKQEYTLAFMLAQHPYEFVADGTQAYIDLDTGEGKTFCGIAAICYRQQRAVIMVPPISKVANQWIDSIEKFTTLKRNEYLYVKGSSMCKKIINGEYKNVKIFIIPRSTILSLVRTFDGDWNVVTKLIDAMNIDIKIVDEAHMDFNTLVNIDCFTHADMTYYMSSSPSRSEKQEKIIYKYVFKDVPKYGKKLKTKEQNHLIPLILMFKSTPSDKWLKAVKTRYGTSLAKYGEYLLAEDGARDEFLDAYVFSLFYLLKFRRNAGRILVICITIDFATQLANITKQLFPYLSTGLFVGSGKDKNKELNNDIIFSTTKSMGTGSEIENHQLTINTTTYSSDVMADQISGRIRKQKNGRKAIYCELVNINHPSARKHYEQREPYLIKKAKDGKLLKYVISNNDIEKVNEYFDKGYQYDDNGNFITKDGRLVISLKK